MSLKTVNEEDGKERRITHLKTATQEEQRNQKKQNKTLTKWKENQESNKSLVLQEHSLLLFEWRQNSSHDDEAGLNFGSVRLLLSLWCQRNKEQGNKVRECQEIVSHTMCMKYCMQNCRVKRQCALVRSAWNYLCLLKHNFPLQYVMSCTWSSCGITNGAVDQ